MVRCKLPGPLLPFHPPARYRLRSLSSLHLVYYIRQVAGFGRSGSDDSLYCRLLYANSVALQLHRCRVVSSRLRSIDGGPSQVGPHWVASMTEASFRR